jgi:hypothetical protein
VRTAERPESRLAPSKNRSPIHMPGTRRGFFVFPVAGHRDPLVADAKGGASLPCFACEIRDADVEDCRICRCRTCGTPQLPLAVGNRARTPMRPARRSFWMSRCSWSRGRCRSMLRSTPSIHQGRQFEGFVGSDAWTVPGSEPTQPAVSWGVIMPQFCHANTNAQITNVPRGTFAFTRRGSLVRTQQRPPTFSPYSLANRAVTQAHLGPLGTTQARPILPILPAARRLVEGLRRLLRWRKRAAVRRRLPKPLAGGGR